MVHNRDSRKTNSAKIIELLGPSVDVQDHDGNTALMFAAKGAGSTASKKGNIGVAKKLLEIGADPREEDKYGYTALGRAMESNEQSPTQNNQNMVEYLEMETVKFIARREFNKLYGYAFSNKGVIELTKKHADSSHLVGDSEMIAQCLAPLTEQDRMLIINTIKEFCSRLNQK